MGEKEEEDEEEKTKSLLQNIIILSSYEENKEKAYDISCAIINILKNPSKDNNSYILSCKVLTKDQRRIIHEFIRNNLYMKNILGAIGDTISTNNDDNKVVSHIRISSKEYFNNK